MDEPTCSEHSLAAGEPLAGSAVAAIDRWLVIEHPPAWGPKGVEDSGLPEQVVAALAQLGARHPRLRVQLVRRPAHDEGERAMVYFAESGENTRSLWSLALDRIDQLPTLPLDAWLGDERTPPGEREQQPLFLVCVHGKRDRCCARLGLPLYRELYARAGDRVLQTTHLGGHRFAATMLTLPDGISYGRLQPDEAEALIAATRRGEYHELASVRGRTAYASEAQAADVALRAQLGERRLDALSLIDIARTSGAESCVRFRDATGREHELAVRREALPPMPQSCGAAPKPGSRLVLWG